MTTNRYPLEAPVRLTRKWVAGLSGLLGLAIGIAGTLSSGAYLKTPPAAPVAIAHRAVDVQALTKPKENAQVGVAGLDAAPWAATLRANITDLNRSLEEMPTLKTIPYKASFDAIASSAHVLDSTITGLEDAIKQHQPVTPVPTVPVPTVQQPDKTK